MRTDAAGYSTIADTLRSEIAALAPNSLLPTEQQLARRFGVSRGTLRRALSLLETSGLLTRQRGRGTSVSPPKITRHLSPLSTFEEDLWAQGIKFETRIVEFRPQATAPDFVRRLLRLSARATVGFLSLVRLVDDRVICHDQRYFPRPLARRFDPLLVQTRAVRDVLTELAGGPIGVVDTESEILAATADIAAVLGLRPGRLIVANTFAYYLRTGAPLEAGVMAYRIDRCKFTFTSHLDGPESRRRRGR